MSDKTMIPNIIFDFIIGAIVGAVFSVFMLIGIINFANYLSIVGLLGIMALIFGIALMEKYERKIKLFWLGFAISLIFSILFFISNLLVPL